MNDRGMIKWQPFDSVTSSKQMIKDILKEKKSQTCVELSIDQLQLLEEKCLQAFYAQIPVQIYYYKNGYYFLKKGVITKIDFIYKKIYLNQKDSFHFKQIMGIKTLQ